VQTLLGGRLGPKTVGPTICWGGGGFDALYFMTRDLLAHRRVNTLVFYDESLGHVAYSQSAHWFRFINNPGEMNGRIPNSKATHWFRFGDDFGALTGLPLSDKGIYYFAAVLGMPRNLLELCTPNLPEDSNDKRPNYYEIHFHADNPETRLGSVRARENIDSVKGAYATYVPFAPQTGVTPADVVIYSSVTKSNFVFLNQPLPAWQIHFARQFGLLAQSHGVRLMSLHLPVIAERSSHVITESRNWPDFLQTGVEMAGISGSKLFSRLSETDVNKLYFDLAHLNINGQQYLTPLITPALLNLYESQPLP